MSDDTSKTAVNDADGPQESGKGATQTTTRAEYKTAAETKMSAVMYIGPNRLGEGLKKYTVYKEGTPENVAELKKKYPQIERLFVNVEDLNGALAAATQTGTPIFLAYKEVEGE